MRSYRLMALFLGALFGGVFLFFFVAEIVVAGSRLFANISALDAALLIFGPMSLIIPTILGWWFPRLSGWWLLVAGIPEAVLISVRYFTRMKPMGNSTMVWLIMELLVAVPMLMAAAFWFKAARGPAMEVVSPGGKAKAQHG